MAIESVKITLPPTGAAPTAACPICIVIVAALDNKRESPGLPLVIVPSLLYEGYHGREMSGDKPLNALGFNRPT